MGTLASGMAPPRQAVLVMPGCAMAAAPRYDVPAPAAAPQGREVFERFVELLYRQRRVRQAFECCVVASGYVDHAAPGHVPHASRAQAMQALRRRFADPALDIEVLHTVYDGDVGMVHLRLHDGAAAEPIGRVEIWRVAGGRITEHWSVAA